MTLGRTPPFVRFALAALVALGLLLTSAPALAQSNAGGEPPARILVMLRLPPTHLRLNEAYSGDYGGSATRTALRRAATEIARRSGLRLIDDWPMPVIGISCFVMEAGTGTSVDEAIISVTRQRRVLWAQPMQTFRTQARPARGDRLFPIQPSAIAWRLAELHRVATGRGVTVAVVDSGIDNGHPDLAGQFATDVDFIDGRPTDPEAHGTGIAGVIAARANNGIGIVGIAPGARLMGLRACREVRGQSATCTSLSLARALHHAIERGASVINLSLSGPPDPLLERLIETALRRGSIVVAAHDPRLPAGGFPASQPGVIAVGDAALPALPANVYGAPARDIPTTQPGGTWDLVNGTSYATAHVSGLVALLRERGKPVRLVRSGGGAVNACATLLMRADRACDCSCALAPEGGARAHR